MKNIIKYIGIGCAVLLFSAAVTIGALLLAKGSTDPTDSQGQDSGVFVDPDKSRRQADTYISENKLTEAIQKLQEAQVVYEQRNDTAMANQLTAEIERLRMLQRSTTEMKPQSADPSVFDPSRTNNQ